MVNQTINAINSTNLAELIIAVNNDTNTVLFGGILVLVYIVLLAGLSQAYPFKDVLLASSASLSVISIFMFALGVINVYFVTFFIILTVGSLIYRIMTGG